MNENFEKIYAAVMQIEGGYAYDEKDPGGETYMGISKRFHPHWDGWEIVALLKIENHEATRGQLTKILNDNKTLQREAKRFYYKYYWEALGCEAIENKELQLELFEQAVNLGKKNAVKNLQKTLNILNRNQQLYPDIKEDGIMGEKTLATVKIASEKLPMFLILRILNGMQLCHYLKTKNEYFIRGWIRRVSWERYR